VLLAFPDGIPGGWNSIRKAHFIGHSMGAQTIRYLQYLMSIDYFSQIDKMNCTTEPIKRLSSVISLPLEIGFSHDNHLDEKSNNKE
jgi:hypothetical protein